MATLRAKSFEVGIPMPIAIKKAGENVEGKFGDQVAFSTSGGTLYLDPEPASVIEGDMRRLGIQYGETFSLTRAQTGGFIVRRAGDSGGNNNGRLPAAAYHNPAPAAPEAAAAAQPTTTNAETARLMACFMQAIDAIQEAQAYAGRKGLGITFTSEDVRATAISCWIQCGKGGAR